MYWVAVKVLFLRQMYGLKHRMIADVLCLAYTVIVLLLLIEYHSALKNAFKANDTAIMFGDRRTDVDPHPLEVIVTPHNNITEELLTEACRILERQYNSSLIVHLRFTESSEQMKRDLERSIWPSIGLEVHKMAADGLEYTLRPVTGPHKVDFSQSRAPPSMDCHNVVGEHSGCLLQLRAAVDAAYMHDYFPNSENILIQSLPHATMSFGDDDKISPGYLYNAVKLVVAGVLVPLSLLFMMCLLASYIIEDRLNGVRELLSIYGLPRWMLNVSWLVFFCLMAIVVTIIQAVMLKVQPYITHISPAVLVIFLIISNFIALIFVNFIANLLTHRVATLLLVIVYWIATCFVTPRFSLWSGKQFVAQAFISLLPNAGSMMFYTTLIEYEMGKKALGFDNIFTSSEKFISPGLVLIMMLLSILIFLALAMYLDSVKPGPYGRARPWYLYKGSDRMVHPRQNELVNDDGFIEEIYDEPIGLKCVNIVKVYGTHKALNNVNLIVVKDKITVLLGHNGAGKTTLFSILCGMFSPTSGKVCTDEYNVFDGSNLSKFRKDLGYCPQENILMNDLTVKEHIIIFGMLKGWSMKKSKAFCVMWTQMFDMHDRRNTQAKKLSGGTKRKLCLAIAVAGEPKYLLLDEPTAGMDIESTRKCWDVLIKEKGSCTVVISTHDMDEAEILGDRIAILAHGQLKCLGSSSFLKKTLDTGYRLNCAVMNRNTPDVIKAVNKIIRNAAILYKTNRSVTFSIPGNMSNNIPELLRGLESQFGEKVSLTLSVSTLDDVFVQFQKDIGVKVTVDKLPIFPEEEIRRSSWNFIDLFMRRLTWIISRRLAVMILLVIILPLFSMIISLYLSYGIMATPDDSKSYNGTGGTFAVISNKRNTLSDRIRYALMSSGINVTESSEDMKSMLIKLAEQDLFTYQSKLLFAFDSHSDTSTAFLPRRTDHSVFTAYSALINALLHGNATIVTHLLPFTQMTFANTIFQCFQAGIVKGVGIVIFAGIVGEFLLVASSYFIVFPHNERSSLFKHLLLMTGLLPEVYWLVNLTFDMLIFLSTCILLTITIGIADLFWMNIFQDPTVLGSLFLVFLLYGISSILFSYIWSFLSKTTSLPLVASNLGSLLIIYGFHLLALITDDVKFEYSFFIPSSILSSSMSKIFTWAVHNTYCDHFSNDCKQQGCQYVRDKSLFGGELKIEYICFAVLIAGYFLVLLFLDHGLGSILVGSVMKVLCGRIKYPVDEVNSQVALEKKRVDGLATESREDHPEIVVNGLGKNYCMKTAVYDVTFAAEPGECFGLVGVNGAGKSTTFKMLVALSRPTKGTAVIEGWWTVAGCNRGYLKRLGYCPQSDGLLKELSARNTLRLFGRLTGVPRNEVGPLVEDWITALDMTEIANRPCGQYSGGNKRKLSLAVSLIGNPPVILLDEPTAGVDPIVRRKMYEILTSSLEKNHQTIILTSHTMSECEAICDRLTIMVKGVMKCLGPIPTLKKIFGKSCRLEVKFTTISNIKQQTAVKDKIESQFSDGYISLTDTQPNRLVFTLETENVKIHDVFATMLKIKSDYPVIDDFNLSETPLEQVFLMFAKQ